MSSYPWCQLFPPPPPPLPSSFLVFFSLAPYSQELYERYEATEGLSRRTMKARLLWDAILESQARKKWGQGGVVEVTVVVAVVVRLVGGLEGTTRVVEPLELP